MLQLAVDYGGSLPIGIEMSGWTLERIRDIRPDIIATLQALSDTGRIEIISGGYNQIIFPLAPWQVNRANLLIGQRVFKEILGEAPTTLLVPEQCWSDALPLAAYDAGFRNIIMEYHNCAVLHPEWDAEERYRPQLVSVGVDTEPLNLIWSDGLLWQRFQRHVQAAGPWPALSKEDYTSEVMSHLATPKDRAIMLYASDAEVFDYRPGNGIALNGEWDGITAVYQRFLIDNVHGRLPRSIPTCVPANNRVLPNIGTCDTPYPTKKQVKYNITRWGVSGSASGVNQQSMDLLRRLGIKPHREFDLMQMPGDTAKDVLKIFGSDYRTHTCPEKKQEFAGICDRLEETIRGLWVMYF